MPIRVACGILCSLVGLCGVFLSGCPLRQIVQAGQGNTDAAMTVLGMLVGAAISHNFALASSGAGPTDGGKTFVVIGIIAVLVIGAMYSSFSGRKTVTN